MAQRRAKIWTIEEKYRPLLKRVKKLYPTLLLHVRTKRIALVGLQARHSPFVAAIYPNRRPWSLLSEQYDYMIVFHSTVFDDKPKSYRLYVVLHELYHIAPLGHVEGSPEYRKNRQHDMEEFKLLINHFGVRLENVKDIYKGETSLLEHKGKSKGLPRIK
jgi:predicted metallopeptidase